MLLYRNRPESALAVYAHPDDADMAAGGTLSLWAESGTRVRLIVVCDGAKGSHDANAVASELAERRRQEMETAARLLGVADVIAFGIGDGEVTNSAALRERLVAEVRAFRPQAVLAPDPTATFFGGVYVNHRDHRELGWAVLDAVAPSAAMPLYFPQAGPAHQVSELFLSGTHEPDVTVDISTVIDRKVAAVSAHISQVSDDAEWVRSAVLGRAEPVGRSAHVRYGEAFRRVELAR